MDGKKEKEIRNTFEGKTKVGIFVLVLFLNYDTIFAPK